MSGRKEARQRPGVVEHQPEVFALMQLQMGQNLVQEEAALGLLVHVEDVVRVIEKLDLEFKESFFNSAI